MEEIFKNIEGYDHYQISNYGRVYSSFGKGKFLTLSINTAGYQYVKLCKDGKVKNFTIHKLVAIYFLDHEPCGMEIVIDHINNDKLNNRLDNLQLISNRENTSKDKTGGSSQYIGVYFVKHAGKFRASIHINGKPIYLGYFDCDKEAGEIYQIALSNIDKFINPKQFRNLIYNTL